MASEAACAAKTAYMKNKVEILQIRKGRTNHGLKQTLTRQEPSRKHIGRELLNKGG
jgi:hypothetical protein